MWYNENSPHGGGTLVVSNGRLNFDGTQAIDPIVIVWLIQDLTVVTISNDKVA